MYATVGYSKSAHEISRPDKAVWFIPITIAPIKMIHPHGGDATAE